MPDEALPDVTAEEILSELHEAGRSGTAAKFARYVAQRERARALDSIMGSDGMIQAGVVALAKALSPEAIDPELINTDPVEDPESTPPEPSRRTKKGGK